MRTVTELGTRPPVPRDSRFLYQSLNSPERDRTPDRSIAFATFRGGPAGVSLLCMSDIGWPGLRRAMAPAGKVNKERPGRNCRYQGEQNVDFDFAADTVQES
jgi:hypothetical protein